MNDLFSLAGKVAIVTGGATGIGAMIAQGLVSSGVKTYISSRKLDALEAMAQELSKHGECIAIQADLSSMAGIHNLVNAVKEKEDSLDILINNAGAAWGESIDSFPEKGWDKVMDLNVKSIFFLTQQLLPLLTNSGSADDPARVVNIASINGITHPLMPTYSYGASKAAVIQLTRHMAADLATQHVNINAIAPGFFPSKMTSHAVANEELNKHIIGKTPLRRMGNEDDMAGTAIYLCSRASAFVCGHTLVLDGGMVAAAG